MRLDYQAPIEVHDFGGVPCIFNRLLAYQACLGQQQGEKIKKVKITKDT